jgi:16S rRNA (guanine966-N2)-methyltransferase
VRVVAGSARGRRLDTPPGRQTRPTTDRVREAIFNALGSTTDFEGLSVLDLYAGSGALGIEALSRGASHCTFVDNDRRAAAMVNENLQRLGLADHATVVHGDAFVELRDGAHYDLVLLDPPYSFDGWPALMAALHADTVVIESDRVIDPGEAWETTRIRSYGGTVVLFARAARRPAPE